MATTSGRSTSGRPEPSGAPKGARSRLAAVLAAAAAYAWVRHLRAERDRLSAILRASPDGMVVVDRSRRVRHVNPALESLLSVDGATPAGRTCAEVLGCGRGDGLGCRACPFGRALDSGRPVTDDAIEVRGPGGRRICLAGSFAPVAGPGEQAVSVVASFRDVTSGREAEQLHRNLLSVASHEIRNPLAALEGFASALLTRSDLSPGVRKELVRGIADQADRLTKLVGDLFEVELIESGRLRIHHAEVDLAALAREVVGHVRSKWGDRAIDVDAARGLPTVRADRSKMEAVLVNLVDNAVKYSPAGGRVSIGLEPGPRSVEISVADEGIGIPPDEMPHLFGRFHRVSTPETRHIEGTGLGLFIVRRLVEAHGGRVSVASVPGTGSTFTVSLPLGPALPA